MSNLVTLGCDPEFFVRPATTVVTAATRAKDHKAGSMTVEELLANPSKIEAAPGNIIPICGLLGGTKKAPLQMAGLGAGFTVQEDGAAGEFNIPPAPSVPEFTSNVEKAVAYIDKYLASKNLVRAPNNYVKLKEEWVAKHPHLAVIGCDPDINAYEGVTPRKLPLKDIGLIRGVGGHIHIGYRKDMCPPEYLARLMDVFVALSLVSMDAQGARRKIWGLPGLYRDKPYGMEYRTLGTFWVFNPIYTRHVAGLTLALMDGLATELIQWQAFYNTIPWHRVVEAISKENGNEAMALITEFNKVGVFNRARAKVAHLTSGGSVAA